LFGQFIGHLLDGRRCVLAAGAICSQPIGVERTGTRMPEEDLERLPDPIEASAVPSGDDAIVPLDAR